MSELTPEARAIIDAARADEAPPAGAKNRIHAAVLAGLATGAAEGTATAASTASAAAGWGLGLKLLLPLVVVGLGVGGAYVAGVFDSGSPQPSALSPQPAAESRQPPAETRQPEPPAVEPQPIVEPEPEAVAVTPEPEPEPEPVEKIARHKPRAQPHPKTLAVPKPVLATAASIREERAIILRARKALDAGDADTALAIADEHAEKFPSGQLTQEREFVRVRAHCQRGDETARDGAEAFLARWPKSPYAAGVRTSCKLEEQP